jgi:hypothetical protein
MTLSELGGVGRSFDSPSASSHLPRSFYFAALALGIDPVKHDLLSEQSHHGGKIMVNDASTGQNASKRVRLPIQSGVWWRCIPSNTSIV